MEEMMSSWSKLVDPLINMAHKRKILTEVDEGSLKCSTSEASRFTHETYFSKENPKGWQSKDESYYNTQG